MLIGISIGQLRWWHVWEAAEIGQIVELGQAPGLCVIAAEGHVERITRSRRERKRIHEVVVESRDVKLVTVARTLALAPEVKTSDPCASPARAQRR